MVEKQLARSDSKKLRDFDWDSDESTAETLLAGSFSDKEEHKDMVRRLTRALAHIRGHKKLRETVEKCRAIPYDPACEEHEKKLMRLWALLKPDEELKNRKTLQWQKIGFQG